MSSVLIIEDDFLESMALEDLFRSHGYTVAGVAVSGEGAVTIATARHPDIVVVDVGLVGRLDGIEAAQRIRAMGDCILIFVTGRYDPEVIARMNAVKPDEIIPKPGSALGILTSIEGALARRKARKEVKTGAD